MYRYLVLAWSRNDEVAGQMAARSAERLRSLPSRSWSLALNGSDFAIYHSGAEPRSSRTTPLSEGRGAVLGTFFPKPPDNGEVPARAQPDAAASAAIALTAGQRLISHYWGRYVAVIRDASTHTLSVLRDPTGGMPCFRVRTGGVHVFFSHLEDVLAIGLGPYAINWRYVSLFAIFPSIQSRETALEEVFEVQPGERVDVANGRLASTLLWNPCDVAAAPATEDPQRAAEELRRLVRMCVQAWAQGHERILHRLSGGLDSSIVASCLQDVQPGLRVACLNWFSLGPQEDERRFAREVAQRARLELIERENRASVVRLPSMLDVTQSPIPALYLYPTEHSYSETSMARELGATALFTGTGGDNVFYRNQSPLALADRLHQRGLFRGTSMKVALDVASIERRVVWDVLREGICNHVLRRSPDIFADAAALGTVLARDILEMTRAQAPCPHPWLPSSQRLPPGKIWHIQSMWPGVPFHEPLAVADQIERVHPLMSQPVIEWCLRLPTHVLIAGGWDRAVARRAFARDVPASIIRRRDKGGITQHVKDLYDGNLPFLREILLDGLLVQRGILDRARLEAALTPSGSATGFAFTEILGRHLSLEVWLRRSAMPGQRVAAQVA
jgi:asparagine synthase (glutamine-hydrolysing)